MLGEYRDVHFRRGLIVIYTAFSELFGLEERSGETWAGSVARTYSQVFVLGDEDVAAGFAALDFEELVEL